MLKAIGRTLVILLIAIAIGWGSYLLVHNAPQTLARGEFGGGERPGFGSGTGFVPGGNFSQGDREGRQGDFGERAGFGVIAGLGGILGHTVLFVAMTIVIVVIEKLIPRRS